MRYRGAYRLPQWLEQGAAVLRDYRTDDVAQTLREIDQPLCLEVGCGKGGFLQRMAIQYPDRFFVGIDRVSSVIAKGAADAVEQNVPNLLYVIGDITDIAKDLPVGRIDRIFLNFSDPWPRRRNHIKRLTYWTKLDIYRNLFGTSGVLEQKTDNRDLFEWSIRSLQQAGWTVETAERDFPTGTPDPAVLSSQYVQTEYETKFREAGLSIDYLRATPPATTR